MGEKGGNVEENRIRSEDVSWNEVNNHIPPRQPFHDDVFDVITSIAEWA
jgi:hypothetical protein